MESIVLTLKICIKSAGVYRCQDHSIKIAFAVSYLAQFLLTIEAKNIFAVWVFSLKSTHYII